MLKKFEGIIISERDYSETSKIVNLLTEEGTIGFMAKGAKSLKSELRSVTMKLCYGEYSCFYKDGKLSILTSGDIINPFKNIKKDIHKISYATFLLELAEQVMRQNKNKEVYNLLVNGLLKIEEGYDPSVITNIIELKYLDYLGVMPVIDSCAICGSSNAIKTLSSDIGGYICSKCYKGEPLVDEKTIKLIRMFYYVDISKISKLDVSLSVKKELNEFLDKYYEKYTGLYLKSKSFLKNLNKLT
jgi:DNA repair protein RecO (recombination protein O)